MKHNLARLAGLLTVLALVLSGCNLIGVDEVKELEQQIADANAKNAQAAVTYEGGSIARGDVYLAYNNQLTEIYNTYSSYIQAGYFDTNEIISYVQESTLEAAVKDVAIAKVFEERGMTIDDDKLAEIENETEEHYKETYDYFYQSASSKKADVRAKETELSLAKLGYTKDMIRSSHLAGERRTMLEEAVKGEVTKADITDDMVAKVRLMGHCAGCMGARMTMSGIVESILQDEVPEIKAVEAVD